MKNNNPSEDEAVNLPAPSVEDTYSPPATNATADRGLFVQASSIEVPPVEGRWLIEQLVGKESVAVVGGDPKLGKSWLVSEIAVSIAGGLPCLGRFVPYDTGTVLVCSGEGPTWLATDRLRNVCGFRGADLGNLPIRVMSRNLVKLDDEADQRAVTREVEESDAKLLIIDPLTAYHSADENSVQGLSPVLQYLDGLRRTTGVSVVLVHHTSKKGSGHGGSRLRGTSSLHGWLDSGLYLRKRGDTAVISVEQRCGPAPDDFHVRLSGEEGAFHLEVVDDVDVAADVDEDLQSRILEALRDHGGPISRSGLRALLKIKNERLTEPLDRLERTGVIRRTADGIELVVEDDDGGGE